VCIVKICDLFIKVYEPKYLKASICPQKDRDDLMAFFDSSAQRWQSIWTRRSKGCLSRDGMLHMMFKLG
jgi:hypothetical protein